MEHPPYHKAHWKHIIKEAFFKSWDIFKRALGTVTLVAIDNSLMEATFFSKTASTDTALLGTAISSAISPVEALAFMFATTFHIPCIMALSTTYKESHSLKWTVKVALFYICNALILSFIVYHIASIFM